ncbi:hypothetical protein JXA84_07235 [candidate division WOR-3 bacterium]|nr:hypothetical protein [candidate division WOR-3 bacterium]
MIIITVSGACSKVGKTTTARLLLQKLPKEKTKIIKFGHGRTNPDRPEKLFTDLNRGIHHVVDLARENETDYLIIESNSALKYINPHVSIFIEGDCAFSKKSSEMARKLADVIVF